MEQQRGLTPGRMLVLACQEWWFWVGAEILLLLFGIYWLPRQSSYDWDDGSQWETSTSAQEQIEEKEEDREGNPDTPEKPPDKVGTSSALAKPFPRTTFWGLHSAMRACSAYKYLNTCKDMIDPLLLLPLRPLILHFFQQRWALWRFFWRDTPVAVESSDQEMCSATSPPSWGDKQEFRSLLPVQPLQIVPVVMFPLPGSVEPFVNTLVKSFICFNKSYLSKRVLEDDAPCLLNYKVGYLSLRR